MPPGSAIASRREATLTTSPKTSPPLTMTSPTLTPIRRSILSSSGTPRLLRVTSSWIARAQSRAATVEGNSKKHRIADGVDGCIVSCTGRSRSTALRTNSRRNGFRPRISAWRRRNHGRSHRHDHPGRAARGPLCSVRDRAVDHLWRHARRQYRAWRFPGACRLSRAVAGRQPGHASVRRDPARRRADVLHRLRRAARHPQSHHGAKFPGADASDLRHVDHFAQRAATDLSFRFPFLPDRRSRHQQHSSRRHHRRRRIPAHRVRRCGDPHLRDFAAFLAHKGRRRAACDIRRRRDCGPDGDTRQTHVCDRARPFLRAARCRRHFRGHPHDVHARVRAGLPALCLRGRRHRGDGLVVGHLRRRSDSRHRTGRRGETRRGFRNSDRPSRVPGRACVQADRTVRKVEVMREDLSYVVSRNTAISNAAVWFGVGAAVVVVAVPWLPYLGTSAFMRWAVEVMCYLLLAQMWNLLAGYGGLMSVGMQAFVGIGGYSVFVLAQHVGVNPFLSIPIAGAMAALAAALTSPLVFRMRGGYFAIGTWVLAEVFRIAFSNVSLLGGGSGQSLTVMTRVDRTTREIAIYLIAATTLIVASVAINLLLRSRFGLGLTALRDSEAAAESQGVDVRALKLQVYTLSSFGAGLVGAIYYTSILRISPFAAFDLNWVVAATFIVVIGGIGTVEGPIVGTAIFFALRWLLADYGTWYWLVMGAVAVLVVMFAPAGVWGYVRARWNIQLLPLQRRLVLQRSTRTGEASTAHVTDSSVSVPRQSRGL